ncbi:MAG: TetR/AcrR family transcriptional regulator [Chloroflexi bacterium]|nr:TetR/AcrR family transcriptional regulator [Chloroflexota bacterium]
MTTARDQIIETTCELLEFQGYHATGLNQIIKESGSPKGSLYYYFPGGKEELVTEAINRVGQVMLERIRANLAEIADPAAAVREFILNVARYVEESGYRTGGPITTVALEMAASSDRLRAACQYIYDGWQAAFYDTLAAGGFADDRARSLATLILASIEGGIILCRTRRSREPLENIAHELGRLIACEPR